MIYASYEVFAAEMKPVGARYQVAVTQYRARLIDDAAFLAVRKERDAMLAVWDNQPSIPTLEPVRDLEISHPQFTLPASEFTLTAPAETDATQTTLF